MTRTASRPTWRRGHRPPDRSVKRLLPWLVAVAFFMQSLDTTILNTAVPAIARAMDVTPLNVKSVLASYTLSLAVFIPVSGWMADRFGTRRVFASAIGLFTLGSVLCGLSTSIDMLVACRVLQGMGGAMMMPVGRMTLARTFGKADLVRAMSFVAIPSLIGPMVGPVAGGLIVTYLALERACSSSTCRSACSASTSCCATCPTIARPRPIRSTSPGLVLFGGGIALLSYVLEVFGEHTLEHRRDPGAAGARGRAARGLRHPRHADGLSRCSISACSGCAPSARR